MLFSEPETWLRVLAIWLGATLVYCALVKAVPLVIRRWRGGPDVDAIVRDVVQEAQTEPSPAVPMPVVPFRQPKEGWAPAPYDEDDLRAIKALAAGKASEGQQRIALTWFIHNAARTYDLPFHPGGVEGQRASDFACGRMFVGQQIIKLINMAMPEKKKGIR